MPWLKNEALEHNVLNAKMHKEEAWRGAGYHYNMAGRGTDIKINCTEVKAAGGLTLVQKSRFASC
jgi:preprotein translocase subunit SecA